MSQTLEAVFYQGDEQERLDHTPSAALSQGEIISKGGIPAVVTTPEGIAADTLGSVATRGVFKVKKSTGGQAFSEGDLVGWDDTNNVAVDGGTGDYDLGYAVADAAGTDDHVKTRFGTAALN